MSDPIYDPKSTAGAAIARATFDVAVQSAITICKTYVPALALPVVSQLFSFAVEKFMDVLYKALEESASFLIIDLKVDKENQNYKDAVLALANAVNTGKSKEEIENEKKKFKDALRNLVSLNPK